MARSTKARWQVHPLLKSQLDQATAPDGTVDVTRLSEGISRVYWSIDVAGEISDLPQWLHNARKMRDSERRFRDVVEAASDWFWESDSHHCLTFISPHIADVLGVKPSALLGTSFSDHGLECDAETLKNHQDDLAAHRPYRDRIFHAGPPEGKDARKLRISGMPIFDDDGTFVGYRGIGIDITREHAAEQRAGKAQQILANAMESLSDGVAVFDVDDRLVEFNRRFSEVFGGMDDVLEIGTTFEELVRSHEDRYQLDGHAFEAFVQARLQRHREANGSPLVIQTRENRWILARECRMAGGGVVSVRTDITELKSRENDLNRLKSHYKIILDSAGEGIIGLDVEGAITFANRMACALLKFPLDHLVGQNFQSLIQPIKADGIKTSAFDYKIGQSCSQGLSHHVTDEVFWRADGTAMPVDYFAGPLMDGELLTGAVLAFRDATLRIQYEQTVQNAQRQLEGQVAERTQELLREVDVRSRTEAALRQSRTRMKAITDCLLEGVLVVTVNGDVAFTNPAARALIVCNADEELEGLPLDDVMKLGGDRIFGFAEGPWAKVAAGQKTIRDDDATFVTADGRKLAVAYACSPLAVEGDVSSCVILFRDIRELKAAQWDSVQASRMASVGQLAAGIAHEINTPTQYIGDNLKFLGDCVESFATVFNKARDILDGQSGAEAEEFRKVCDEQDIDYLIEEIPRAITQSSEGVHQVSRIVLSMKEFSHPGSTNHLSTDINRALESTLTVSRNTWKHVAEVETHFDPDLPMVLCYAGELNQVFLNLVVNAAQAIEELHQSTLGRITLTTGIEDDWVKITVADTGPGIPAAIRDRVFDPFFTTKAVGKGTGQGLAICRDVVVTKHKGRLDLETEEGKGAIFTIRIPIHPPEDNSSRDPT